MILPQPPRPASILVACALFACPIGCTDQGPVDTPPTEDTSTDDEPNVLPIDTSQFIPQDTAPVEPPNIDPRNFVYLRHSGNWTLSGSPFSDLAGTLRVAEYIDEIDTSDTSDPDPFLCEVVYNITGSAVPTHTCGSQCDFVFEVEHYIASGSPGPCVEPDVPENGAVWQLGFDSANSQILLNYFGTDRWLPWYRTTTAPPSVDFEWEFTLAIELEDTANP